MKKVYFVAAEGLPFIKSGGLADVIGSLPQVLVKEDFQVKVFLPMYKKIAETWLKKMDKLCQFRLQVGIIDAQVNVFSYSQAGVDYVFIQHQGYFERDGMYGYPDDGERFAFFSHAVLKTFEQCDDFPDILHSHDWHTGVIPLLSRVYYKRQKKFQAIKHVYTIHNLAYQGLFPTDVVYSCLGLDHSVISDGTLRFDDGISYMKAGILYAQKVTTVSPTYAKEILTPAYGEKMEGVLKFREYDLVGILNGIDVDLWNPATDPLIKANYDVETLKNKHKNKTALQKEVGLRVSKNVFLVGMVTRLTWQKGVHLLIDKIADVMGLDLQIVVLGSGEATMESSLVQFQDKYNRRFAYYQGYNEELAHKIYAGVDCFLMPSLFEPCGLAQMISMRYGTLPLVRETGGLKDTVIPYNQYENVGTGFSFEKFNSDDFYHILRLATFLYYLHPTQYRKMIVNAMHKDVSWENSAKQYKALYDSLK
jgi:starch synthase